MTQRLHARRRRIATLPELSFVEAAQPASWMHEGSKSAFTSATEHICTPASSCRCIHQTPLRCVFYGAPLTQVIIDG
jgi:hypothetical protein